MDLTLACLASDKECGVAGLPAICYNTSYFDSIQRSIVSKELFKGIKILEKYVS